MSLDQIKALVSRFADHLSEYKSGAYNETQVRHDFIDPFFEALGWDMNNKQGFSQTFRQVIRGKYEGRSMKYEIGTGRSLKAEV